MDEPILYCHTCDIARIHQKKIKYHLNLGKPYIMIYIYEKYIKYKNRK